MKIILPLDVTNLTPEDSVKINDCETDLKSGDINQITHGEQVLVAFSRPIEIINPFVNEITYNNTLELAQDIQQVKNDKSSVLMKAATTAGITPDSVLTESGELDPDFVMEEFYYAFDVIDRNEIDNLVSGKKLRYLFHISFQFFIEIFSCTGKNHNHQLPVFFIYSVCKFVIGSAVVDIKAINSCQISCFQLTNVRVTPCAHRALLKEGNVLVM